MSARGYSFVDEKRVTPRGWYRAVRIGEAVYYIAVERGNRVRIAFKPRAEGFGFHWHASVRDAQSRRVWAGRCDKSTGAEGILRAAGLIP